MTNLTVLTLATLLFATGAARAEATTQDALKAGTQVTETAVSMTDGEVRKIDMDTKKITIKHGEIKNLGMPGMTMVFQAKDPAMLEKVKAGDKVRFTADKVNGAFTVTNLEPAK